MSSVDCQQIHERVQHLMNVIRARPAYLNDKDAVHVLAKAAINGNKICRETSAAASEGSSEVSSTLLCDYAQFLLDYSYAIEVKIVNEEFSECCRTHMQTVTEFLDEVLVLLDSSKGSQSIKQSHYITSRIKELLECVFWRKGALLYMFCHTIYKSHSDSLTTQPQKMDFLSKAKDGVVNLAFHMREVRREETTQDYETRDGELMSLIKQGIFSDVHMLSLMYASEMCYWICSVGGKVANDVFNPSELGRDLASQYIDIAEGPLKEAKWSTEHARQIIRDLG